MRVLKIQQNSEEWFEFRKGKSGGSEFKDLWIPGLPLKSKIVECLERDGQVISPADKRAKSEELAAMLEPHELAKLKLDSERKRRYYEMIAEDVARPITPNDYADELNGAQFTMMARGHILEPQAIKAFTAKTGKYVHSQSCIWQDEQNPLMYISPDGVVCKIEELEEDIELIHPKEAVEVKCLSSWEIIKAYLEDSYPKEYEPQVVKYFVVNRELEVLYLVLYTDAIPGLELQIFEIHRDQVANRIEEARAFDDEITKMIADDIKRIRALNF